mgnify:CR=1 FL=1
MVSGRYIKIIVDDAYYNAGWYLTTIPEIEIYDTNNTNVALNKTVTVSGYYDSTNTPALKIVDGTKVYSTWKDAWVSQNVKADGTNVWCQIDLGLIVNLNKIRLYKFTSMANNQGYASLKSYKIFVSTDGTIWGNPYLIIVNEADGIKNDGTDYKEYAFVKIRYLIYL